MWGMCSAYGSRLKGVYRFSFDPHLALVRTGVYDPNRRPLLVCDPPSTCRDPTMTEVEDRALPEIR